MHSSPPPPPPYQPRGPAPLPEPLLVIGIIFWVIGLGLLIAYGIFYDTTLYDTHNIGKMQNRLVGVIVSASLLVSGSILIAASRRK